MRARHAALLSLADGHTLPDFVLLDSDDESGYGAIDQLKDRVVNPCLDSTYWFIEYVLLAIKKIYEVGLLKTRSY